MIGMNCELMCEYIEYVADHLLVELECDKVRKTFLDLEEYALI